MSKPEEFNYENATVESMSNHISKQVKDFQEQTDYSHLYHENLSEMRWGYKAGKHAAHIVKKHGRGLIGTMKSTFTKGKETAIEKGTQNDLNVIHSTRIKQGDIYRNVSEEQTRANFMSLARFSACYYEKFPKNSKMREIMRAVRDYITASERLDQRESLKILYILIEDRRYDLNKKYNRKGVRPEEEFYILTALKNGLDSMTQGKLILEPVQEEQLRNEKVKEPASYIFGGHWSDRSEEQLFPHEPSVNDIKQGIGVQDCFALSALSVKAAKDPAYIKGAIKDLEDGTVVVRFYKKVDGEESKKEPVYIRVKKTARHLAGMNVYSGSALWVQMIEKAFALYQEKYNPKTTGNGNKKSKGFHNLSQGNSMTFLDAFTQDSYRDLSAPETSFGVPRFIGANREVDARYSMEHPEQAVFDGKYSKQEEAIYNYLLERVNKRKEIITTGFSVGANNIKYASFVKSKGVHVEHAYGVLGVFEKENALKEKRKYVVLRDPYAAFTVQYGKNGKLKKGTSDLGISATIFAGKAEHMGQFVLDLFDYMRLFNGFMCEQKSSTAPTLMSMLDDAFGVKQDENSKEDMNKVEEEIKELNAGDDF